MFLSKISSLFQAIHQYKSLPYRFLIIFLSVLICASSCFSYAVSTQEITLTLLVQSLEAPEWKPLVKDLKEKENIDIKIVEGSDAPNVLEAAYVKDFTSRKPHYDHYDLVYMDTIWTAKFASEEWLTDLSELFKKEEINKFLFDEVESGRYGKDKKLYRIPFHSDVSVLFYRKDLLNRIGREPPETFEDLTDISKELQKLQKEKSQERIPEWGYVWQGQEYEGLVATFIEILYGYGGHWIEGLSDDGYWIEGLSDDGYWIEGLSDVGLDKTPALEAVKFLRNTIYKERISPESVTAFQEDETRKVFQDEDAVFLRNWPYVWFRVNSLDSPIRGRVAIAEISSPCRGGWGLGISSRTDYPEAAKKAIKFLTSANSQRRYALRTGNLPTRRSLFYDPLLVEKYNYFPKLLKILEKPTTITRPSTPQYCEISKILQKPLYEALRKKPLSDEEISKMMKDAADKTRDCLKGNCSQEIADECGGEIKANGHP